MKINRHQVEEILSRNEIEVCNTVLIKKLLDDGELDYFFDKIVGGNVKVIRAFPRKKEELNPLEQFLVNLDFFINHIDNNFSFLRLSNLKILISRILKSSYCDVLLKKEYIYTDIKSGQFYIKEFDKAIVEQFYFNLTEIRYYISPFLIKFNLKLDDINLSRKKDCQILYELLSALILTSPNDLWRFNAFTTDLKKCIITDKDININLFMPSLELPWQIAFEDLLKKFDSINIVYPMGYLKLSKKPKMTYFDKTIRLNHRFLSDFIDTFIVDKHNTVVFSHGNIVRDYFCSKIIYPQFLDINKGIKQNGIEYFSRDNRSYISCKAGIQFSDGKVLDVYNEIYPIYESEEIVGYQVFLKHSKCFNKSDRNYINEVFNYIYKNSANN